MQKTVKIFGKLISLKQLILGVVALLIFIGAAIYLIRFFFPSQPESIRAATPTTTQEQINTDIFKDQQFQYLQDQSSDGVTAPKSGRTDPFKPVTSPSAETGGTIQNQ